MSKIFAIASREYFTVIRSKAFILSIVLIPAMMFGSFLVQRLGQKVHDVNDRHIALIDRTPGAQLTSPLEARIQQHNEQEISDPVTHQQIRSRYVLEKIAPAEGKEATDQQRFELSERIRHGDLLSALEIGRDVMEAVVPEKQDKPPESQIVQFQSNNPSALDFRRIAAETIIGAVRTKRLANAGIKDHYESFITPTRVSNLGLARKDASGAIIYGEADTDLASFLLPFALVMMMFMVVLIGAVPMLQGIAEEKQNRIAEVLLGSVSPFSLMAGKVLGLVATSSTLIILYLAGAYWSVVRLHMAEYLPAHVIVFFVVFQVLAVLMYGSLYIAIGAACNDPNQMQSLLLPVNLLMALPLIMMLAVIQSPRGPVARILTFFPPATPFISVARIALPSGISTVEIVIAIVLVVLTTIALIWASGRIFRIGLLVQGKSPNIAQLLKWVISG